MASDETTIALKRPEYLRRYFEQTGREYVTGRNIKCPDKSAHKNGDANPSAKIYENANGTAHIHCHGCGKDWDIFSLWELDNGGKFPEAKKALCAMFGIDATATSAKHTAQVHALTGSPTQAATARPEPKAEPDTQTKQHITACAIAYHNGDNAGRDYLRARGIGDETARRFGVGFDAQKNAVIIPYGYGYAMRFIAPLKRKDGSELKAMYEPKGKPRALFNGTALEQAARNGTPVYIVEGEIDALSIAEVGGIAIATGGTGSRSKAVKAITNIGRGAYIPLMDRDEAGEKAQAELERELEKIGGMVSVFKGAPELLLPNDENGKHPKDANEALQNDAARFAARVAEIAKQTHEQFIKQEKQNAPYFSFADIPNMPPEDKNPRVLFKNGYLRKGGGIIAASVAGAGKSTFSIQCALHWVLGKPCFGIAPIRELRIAIIQSEDDIEELAMFKESMRKGLSQEGWTDEQIHNAFTRLIFRKDFLGKTGDEFAAALRSMQEQDHFDLVIVNPLNSYFGGDISIGAECEHFFREMIDPIIKSKSTECGLMFIHHSGKPPKGKDAAQFGKGAFAQYTIRGASTLNDWARAILVLYPFESNTEFWNLQAAKRYKPLGWTDADGKPTKDFVIAYSKDCVYWRTPTQEEITAAKQGTLTVDRKTALQEQHKEKYEKSLLEFVEYLKRESIAGRHLSMTAARYHAQEVFSRTIGEKVYNAFKDNLHGYGFVQSEYKNGTRFFIFKNETPPLPTTPEAEASADDSAPDEDEDLPIPF